MRRVATGFMVGLAVSLSAADSSRGQPQPDKTAPEFDADAPLDPMLDIGVAWPDMKSAAEGEIIENVEPGSAREAGEAIRYRVQLEGLERLTNTPAIDRFNGLSVLRAGEKDPANSAQIDRRIREDSRLLQSILRASGHFDPMIDAEVETEAAGQLRVRLIVVPGPLYTFKDVDIVGLDQTGEKAAAFGAVLGIDGDDAVDADDVNAGQTALTNALKETGYPFAKVAEPDIIVDHDSRTARLAMRIDPGGARRFGSISVVGERPPFGAQHVGNIARFKPGQPFDQAQLDDLRRALIATGVAGAVTVTPVPAHDPALADIKVVIEPAPLRTIAGEIGYGTGEGARAEASWTHRNLLGAEGALTISGVIGTREQELGSVIRKSNFRARDVVLTGQLGVTNSDLPAFEARTVQLGLGIERQSNIIWHKRWTWSAGAELLATDERDMLANAIAGRERFFIAALPLALGYDRSNDLLDPLKGFRIGLRAAPEISLRNGSNAYVRLQLDASGYLPVTKRIVLAGRMRAGTIAGTRLLALAPSRRFYAGGGSSVRGFGYQQIGPLDADGDPSGGRGLAEFSLEARVRWREFGIVPFLDGGNISSGSLPKLDDLRLGAGLGLRYHSSFGPIRVDVGTPLGRRKGEPPVTVFVSLGQAF